MEGNVIGAGLEEVDEKMVRLGRIRIEAFVELESDLAVWSRAGDFVVDALLGPFLVIIPLACDGCLEGRVGQGDKVNTRYRCKDQPRELEQRCL